MRAAAARSSVVDEIGAGGVRADSDFEYPLGPTIAWFAGTRTDWLD